MHSNILVVTWSLPLYCFSPGISRTTMWRKEMPARTCWIDVQSWEVFLKSLSGLWCIPVIMVSLFIPGCRDIDRVRAAPLDRSQTCSGKRRLDTDLFHFVGSRKQFCQTNAYVCSMHNCATSLHESHKWCAVETNGTRLLISHHKHLSSWEVPFLFQLTILLDLDL